MAISLALKCSESLTAIGCGLVAASMHLLDGGLAAGMAVGGIQLISRFKEHCAKHGLDEPELTAKMQKAVLRRWDKVDVTQEQRDIITLADAAMSEHLLKCMLTREELAASSIAVEPYPKRAARLVTDRLAERDPMFSADRGIPLARKFALTVIEDALNEAKNDQTYAALLTLDLLIAGNSAHATTHCMLHDQARSSQQQALMLQQIFEAVKPKAEENRVADEALFALARRVVGTVDGQQQAISALTGAIDGLVRMREEAARGTNYGPVVENAVVTAAAHNELGELAEGAAVISAAFRRIEKKEEELNGAKATLVKSAIEQAYLQRDTASLLIWIGKRAEIFSVDGGLCRSLLDEYYSWSAWASQRADPFMDRIAEQLAGMAFLSALGGTDIGTLQLLALESSPEAHFESLTGLTEDTLNIPEVIECMLSMVEGVRRQISQLHCASCDSEKMEAALAMTKAAIEYSAIDKYPREWALSQQALGNLLYLKGFWGDGKDAIRAHQAAVTAIRNALTAFKDLEAEEQWAMKHDLAITLEGLALRVETAKARPLIRQAINAISSSSYAGQSQIAAAQNWAALGRLNSNLGELSPGREGVRLLKQSISSLNAAKDEFEKEQHLIDWAEALIARGEVLKKLGLRTKGKEGSQLLWDAYYSLQNALQVYTLDWFQIENTRVTDMCLEVHGLLQSRDPSMAKQLVPLGQ